MKSTLIAALAAPTIALTGLGVGATGGGAGAGAYGGAIATLTGDQSGAMARALFERADLDASGALDADEYAALAIVTAELARLNGFIALAADGAAEIVALPIKGRESLSRGERARIDAVARAEFYAAAGADGQMSKAEYAAERAAGFAAADRDGDGRLKARELTLFAAAQARLSRSDA
jgi:hypothetical protein